MNEELINQIVRRILSEPSFQCLLQGNVEGKRAVKPNGLVLLNFVPDFERVLTAVEKRWGTEYTLNILPSDSVGAAKPDLPKGMSWITSQDALSKAAWPKIILPACSLNTLAKAALGIRDNPLSEIIGRAITTGIPVELVTEYLGFSEQTPKTYLELYEGYLRKVQSYGIQVFAALEEQNTLDTNMGLVRTVSCVQNTLIRAEILFEKKYLADKDACSLPEQSIIWVKRGTAISPLARDTLKMRRIELRVEMEGGRR